MIIAPGIILLPLIYTPSDLATALFFWLPAKVSFVLSLLSIVIFVTKIINAKRKNFPLEELPLKLLQPILVIVVFTLALILVAKSMDYADSAAKDVALKVENECKIQNICPQTINGWEITAGETSKSFGYTAKYNVRYLPSQDLKSFQIVVHHNIDEAYIISGGVAREVTF